MRAYEARPPISTCWRCVLYGGDPHRAVRNRHDIGSGAHRPYVRGQKTIHSWRQGGIPQCLGDSPPLVQCSSPRSSWTVHRLTCLSSCTATGRLAGVHPPKSRSTVSGTGMTAEETRSVRLRGKFNRSHLGVSSPSLDSASRAVSPGSSALSQLPPGILLAGQVSCHILHCPPLSVPRPSLIYLEQVLDTIFSPCSNVSRKIQV